MGVPCTIFRVIVSCLSKVANFNLPHLHLIHEMSSNVNTSRPRCRPVKQGPHPQLSNRGWVEKSHTGRNLKLARQQLTVGIWNLRTLRETGKLEQLRIEIERYRCDMLGLGEVRWMGSAELNGGEFIWSGESLLGYKPVKCPCHASKIHRDLTQQNLSIIQVYAPMADSTEELISFYNKKAMLSQRWPHDVPYIWPLICGRGMAHDDITCGNLIRSHFKNFKAHTKQQTIKNRKLSQCAWPG